MIDSKLRKYLKTSIIKKLFYNVHIYRKKKGINFHEKEINKILLSKIIKCQVYRINLKYTLDLI